MEGGGGLLGKIKGFFEKDDQHQQQSQQQQQQQQLVIMQLIVMLLIVSPQSGSDIYLPMNKMNGFRKAHVYFSHLCRLNGISFLRLLHRRDLPVPVCPLLTCTIKVPDRDQGRGRGLTEPVLHCHSSPRSTNIMRHHHHLHLPSITHHPLHLHTPTPMRPLTGNKRMTTLRHRVILMTNHR